MVDGFQLCQSHGCGTIASPADRIPEDKASPGGVSVFQRFQSHVDGYQAGLRMKEKAGSGYNMSLIAI